LVLIAELDLTFKKMESQSQDDRYKPEKAAKIHSSANKDRTSHFKIHQRFGGQGLRIAAGIIMTGFVVGCGAATAVYYSSDQQYTLHDLVNFFGGI